MTTDNIQIFKIVWQGIPITIKFNPCWSKVYDDIQGSKMTHTEVIRDDRKELPITGSGYRSHFMDERDFADYSDITTYVLEWLDHEAQSKNWKNYVADQNQLKLF